MLLTSHGASREPFRAIRACVLRKCVFHHLERVGEKVILPWCIESERFSLDSVHRLDGGCDSRMATVSQKLDERRRIPHLACMGSLRA